MDSGTSGVDSALCWRSFISTRKPAFSPCPPLAPSFVLTPSSRVILADDDAVALLEGDVIDEAARLWSGCLLFRFLSVVRFNPPVTRHPG